MSHNIFKNSFEVVDTLTDRGLNVVDTLTDKSEKAVHKIYQTADISARFVTSNVYKYMPTFIVSALLLLAAGAWNTTIQTTIDSYVPLSTKNKYNAWTKIAYAFILSVIIVIIIALINYYLPVEVPKK
jgi:uncharacterized BrkB/YihY/UPF0761 family membrane protein